MAGVSLAPDVDWEGTHAPCSGNDDPQPYQGTCVPVLRKAIVRRMVAAEEWESSAAQLFADTLARYGAESGRTRVR